MKSQSQDLKKNLRRPLLKLQLVNVIFIPSIPFCYHGWNYLKNVLRDENYRLFLCLFWGEAPGETQTHFCDLVENFGENGKANFLARWLLHRQNFPRARTSDKPCKGTLSKTYVCMYVCMYVLIITGVQASGVIIDRLLRQCCFVWSENCRTTLIRQIQVNRWSCLMSVVLQFSDHSKQHCRNKRSMITPEAWTPVTIVNALQLNELSALRNTFYPEYKYVCMYVCMYVCN